MSLTQADDRPVHFPANPDRFEFDAEVSKVFDDIADRSIPNFRAAHIAHARMLKAWIKPGQPLKVLDVGASRGAFINALRIAHRGVPMEIDTIDNSPEMCAYLKMDYPGVRTQCLDLTSPGFLDTIQPLYDVVCVNYVLQFLPRQMRYRVLNKLISMVRVGGVLIIGHKSLHYGKSGEAAHEEYIRFRVANGYTREEIEAKTQALKGSMWPMDHEALRGYLAKECAEVTETFRFMMFSTLFAVK